MPSYFDQLVVYDDAVSTGPQDDDTGYVPEGVRPILYDGPCNAQDTGLEVIEGQGAGGGAIVSSNARCYLPDVGPAVLAIAAMKTGNPVKVKWKQTGTWSEGQVVEARRMDRRVKLMLVGPSA